MAGKESLNHSLEHEALSSALYAIDQAEHWLAAWCPHGMDSARAADYQAARRARELLQEAKVELQVAEGWGSK